MILSTLLRALDVRALTGPVDQDITGLTLDSRRVGPGIVFFALRGTQTDGHRFIPQVLAAGAAAIVCQELPADLPAGLATACIVVPNSGEAMGWAASAFYGYPSQHLTLVGITGTNGKTTCATLLFRLFRELGYGCGLLSTVENRLNDTIIPATHTTPDAIALNALLRQMVDGGCDYVFMEVSSHAQSQRRTAGLLFAGGIFTNLTHDHLDYHGSFAAYRDAKKSFFDQLPELAFALTNADDRNGAIMLQNTRARRLRYSLRGQGDVRGRLLENTVQGLHVDVNGQPTWFQLMGEFNAYNLLAVYGAAVALGQDAETVLTVLSGLPTAPGRFERQTSPDGRTTGIVDYAHTPDALENVLTTIQHLRRPEQRILTVVGCGGNRDATKRPLMAGLAARLSDVAILTADNPRDEDPLEILRQMEAGLRTPLERTRTRTVPDRREAIRQAVTDARPGDIILVAGKGHEPYQEIKGVRHPFDDRQELRAALQELRITNYELPHTDDELPTAQA
ncbi:MAG: UDP-N-acetylmuramoyl-L-alanyl-D-glutamate--2,6-diaminopimelate ligase [Hymenobacteraceae bacterium]|nr:UDP-N-acetylmuramoyl-L-alanyl-D-glutamate--2,6-diaminopimelate ligase [Hymenobacteraceae bacterium]